jgi:hypothetical protein
MSHDDSYDMRPPVGGNGMSFDDFFRIINPGKPLPRSGACMECAKPLTPEDKDHSFCNSCWDDIFTCPECGDKEGNCEH